MDYTTILERGDLQIPVITYEPEYSDHSRIFRFT